MGKLRHRAVQFLATLTWLISTDKDLTGKCLLLCGGCGDRCEDRYEDRCEDRCGDGCEDRCGDGCEDR